MDWTKKTPEERAALIRLQQKEELTNLVKHYFNTFGWNLKEEAGNLFVQKILPGETWRLLMVVNAPHEEYPSKKELAKLLENHQMVVVSSEFSPILPNNSFITDQHTASGLNFAYLQKVSNK